MCLFHLKIYFLYLMDVELDLEVDLGVLGMVDVGCHWRVPSKQYAEKSTQYITANNNFNSDIEH